MQSQPLWRHTNAIFFHDIRITSYIRQRLKCQRSVEYRNDNPRFMSGLLKHGYPFICMGQIGVSQKLIYLTHWGRTTHICVGKLTTICSNNGLSPARRHAGILLIGPLGTNFSEILIGIQAFSFKKMHLKMASTKWRRFVSASMS